MVACPQAAAVLRVPLEAGLNLLFVALELTGLISVLVESTVWPVAVLLASAAAAYSGDLRSVVVDSLGRKVARAGHSVHLVAL